MLTLSPTDTSFYGVKYTRAGKSYYHTLPNHVKETLNIAEYCMLENKNTNLVVNKKGFTVQYKDTEGKHTCYKIKRANYDWKKDIVEYQVQNKKINKLEFDLKQFPQMAKKCMEHISKASWGDTQENFLQLNLDLITLLEAKGKSLQKDNVFQKIFTKIFS